MTRNHTPKPLYGARKTANDTLYCTQGCKRDAIVGYRRWNGTYDWRCGQHVKSATSHLPKISKTEEYLRSLGLVL